MTEHDSTARRTRRRAGKRGVATIPARAFQLGIYVMSYGAYLAFYKYAHNSLEQRRAAEVAVQNSINASASPCQSVPMNASVASTNATSSVSVASPDMMGLDSALLPPVPLIGLSPMQAFPSHFTPLTHTATTTVASRVQAEDAPKGAVAQSVHSTVVTRQLNCQDVPQPIPSPLPNIKKLSTQTFAFSVPLFGGY